MILGAGYRCGEQIGGGMTGEVFSATDPQGNPCAVKLIAANILETPQATAMAMSQLALQTQLNHPNIVRVHASGATEEGRVWYAQDLVASPTSLFERVGKDGAMAVADAASLIAQLSAGLEVALSVGVTHADLAPKNVLIGADGVPRLINFSVPLRIDAQVLGVPEYVPPELANGGARTQQAATYSLGAMFYFLATGVPPYTGETSAVLEQARAGHVISPSTRNKEIPEAVDAIVRKALNPSPGARHLTLGQLAQELTGLQGAERTPRQSTMPPSPPPKTGKPPAKTMLGIPEGDALQQMTGGPRAGSEPARPAQVRSTQPGQAVTGSAGAPSARQPSTTAAARAESQPASPQVRAESQPASPQAADVRAGTASTAPPPTGSDAALRAATASTAPPPSEEAPAAARGKRGGTAPPAESSERKGKFRETLWFKKGELDSEAKERAANEANRSGRIVADRADSLPINERYRDDGSVTTHDRSRYSLKTGNTVAPPMEQERNMPRHTGNEQELISEVTKSRTLPLVGIVVGILLIVGLVIYATSHGDDKGKKKPAAKGGDTSSESVSSSQPASSAEPASSSAGSESSASSASSK